jgi:hypothetical protein
MVYKSFGKFADGRAQYEKWLLQRPEFRVEVAYCILKTALSAKNSSTNYQGHRIIGIRKNLIVI